MLLQLPGLWFSKYGNPRHFENSKLLVLKMEETEMLHLSFWDYNTLSFEISEAVYSKYLFFIYIFTATC